MLTAHHPVVPGWRMSGDLLHFSAFAKWSILHLLKYLIPSPSPPLPPSFHLRRNIWWRSQIMKFNIINLLQRPPCLHSRMIRYLHSTCRWTQFEDDTSLIILPQDPRPRVLDRFLRVTLHVRVTIRHGFQVTLDYTGCSFYYATLNTKPRIFHVWNYTVYGSVLTSVVDERFILTMKQTDCLLFFGVSLGIAILLPNLNEPMNMLDTVPQSMYFTRFVLYFIKF